MELVLYLNPPVYTRANLVLLQNSYARQEREGWLKFRFKYLHTLQKERGVLQCEYCGKGPLIIEVGNWHPLVATIDHVIPVSKGGGRYDTENMKVACYHCNQKKADKMPE